MIMNDGIPKFRFLLILQKYHNMTRNRDFSYPDRMLVGIRDFQAKSE